MYGLAEPTLDGSHWRTPTEGANTLPPLYLCATVRALRCTFWQCARALSPNAGFYYMLQQPEPVLT